MKEEIYSNLGVTALFSLFCLKVIYLFFLRVKNTCVETFLIKTIRNIANVHD